MAAVQQPLEPGLNKLLAALPRRDRDRLVPELKPVSLGFEEVLYEPDGFIRQVYFPTSGVISLLLLLEDGSVAEVGRVGNEGWSASRSSWGYGPAGPGPSCRSPARPCA